MSIASADSQEPSNGRKKESEQLSQASDVAWLHHIHGLSQAEIADRRGLSRMKVHRLIQLGYDSGLVRVFVDSVPTYCSELETQLIKRFGLTACMVVPDAEPEPDMFATMPAISSAAAMMLFGKLESTEPRTIGIGSGRTMAATTHALPPVRRPETSFVSLTGDFAVLNDANPFEVINTLVTKTGGKGHAFTAPLVVESREDRDLFLRQRGVSLAMDLVRNADFFFTGLGNVEKNSFLASYGLMSEEELQQQLRDLDIAADVAGNLMNSQGEFIKGGVAERMLAVNREELFAHPLIIVGGGSEKARAMLAALRSGCVNGVVTNEGVARSVLKEA